MIAPQALSQDIASTAPRRKGATESRVEWLLILQGFAILGPVFTHSLLALNPGSGHWLDVMVWNAAQTCRFMSWYFSMALMFMISGYLLVRTRLSRGCPYARLLRDRSRSLGIPYLFFITLTIGVKLLFADDVLRSADVSLSGWIMNYIDPLNGAMRQMWFVGVIFIYILLYPLYRHLLRNAFTIAVTFIAALAMYFLPSSAFTSVLSLGSAVHYFIFYFSGMILASCGWDVLTERFEVTAFSILLITTGFADPASDFGRLLIASGTCLLALGLARRLAAHRITCNAFSSFRGNTYQIFLMAIFPQILVKVMMTRCHADGLNLLWWLLAILSGIYLPVFFTRFLIRRSMCHAPIRFLLPLIGIKPQ